MTATADRAGRLASDFREQFGVAPDGVWSAPGRVNLLGEHTDYNDGFVLPAAIDREVLAAVRRRPDDLVTCRSTELPEAGSGRLDQLGPGTGAGWSAYVLGVVWALREAGVQTTGLDILVSSDVPVGAGLSSSAALEAVTALAVTELAVPELAVPEPAVTEPAVTEPAVTEPAVTGAARAGLSRTELAVACRRAETEVVGAPVGVMDQMASLHGRAGCALLLDCRSLIVEAVPLGLEAAGLALLVIDTRVHHAHAGGEYADRRRACDQAAAALGVRALRDADLAQVEERLDGELRRCARHVVTENARVLRTVDALRTGDFVEVGALFAASHASMRDDFRISCAELDTAVESAGQGGAVAARMTGGGFGGCAVALTPVGEQASLTSTVQEAFARAGFRAPDVFAVQPSPGAARLW